MISAVAGPTRPRIGAANSRVGASGMVPPIATAPLISPNSAGTSRASAGRSVIASTNAFWPDAFTILTYGATETVDFRYSGSITVDTRHTAKLALRGRFDDFGTYIYDAGRGGVRTNDDWYARDTVGVYIAAMDAKDISRLNEVLEEFMPVTDRAVFIKDS